LKRTVTLLVALSSMLMLLLAGTANAAVTMTSWSNGTGFVGKGDVQTAYGWNNKRMQAESPSLGFFTTEINEFTGKCGPTFFRVTVERTTILASSVIYETRQGGKAGSGQVNGFNLTGEGLFLGTNVPSCLIGTISDVQLQKTTFRLYVYRTIEFQDLVTLPLLASTTLLASEQTYPAPLPA
jgi:hypothetical protein